MQEHPPLSFLIAAGVIVIDAVILFVVYRRSQRSYKKRYK